ncbi:YdcF family protein [Prosthecobacter sp.]|uniref:YdcF family protein n=1 Tax=Prosthecobacter sp. TaxID=1965333 RepID=UPI001DEC5B3D|nr:YdcF family protein [Prosthecobacter sp.]MCB1275253.1 YdcF family protein [Prosthecobacter sp.]
MTSFLKSCVDFMEPPGLIWLALSIMCVLHIRRRRWRSLWLTGSAWLLLTVTAALPVSQLLVASLEKEWPPVDLASLPECDAIMVLGGTVEPSVKEPAGIHFFGGSDRLFTAVTLARMGKGKKLIIGGGAFKTTDGRFVSEGDSARDWIRSWQLTSIPIQSLGGCLDTHDEAVKVAALARENDWKRIALVTSAYHMRRTQAVFAKAGVPVVPVPCNYESALMRGRSLKWINVPNASHLTLFETWMHEVIGWWVYKLRGWI